MCNGQLITRETAKNRIVGVLSPQGNLQQPLPPKSHGTLWKRRQKECESVRMGNDAAKRCLLGIKWMMHLLAYLSQDLHNIRPPERLANMREVLSRNHHL